MRLNVLLSSMLLACLVACGAKETRAPEDDTTATDTGTALDGSGTLDDATDGSGSGSDVTEDTRRDVPTDVIETQPINIILTNLNPTETIYVQTSNQAGVPTWYGLFDANRNPVVIHDSCAECNCPETSCGVCGAALPTVQELRPSQEITATWTATRWEDSSYRGQACEWEVELTAGDSYFMQFCWTREAPDAEGNLPIANMSCTQVPFQIGDTEVFYDGN
jgi:hypothetical protein